MHDEEVSGIGSGAKHHSSVPCFKQIVRAQFELHRMVMQAFAQLLHLLARGGNVRFRRSNPSA